MSLSLFIRLPTLGPGRDPLFIAFLCSRALWPSDCGSTRLLLLVRIRLVHALDDLSCSDKQDPPARRPLWPFVADLCAAPEGHRMELSGGRLPGLQPANRKSWTAVHCRSKWPLRVQRDGQLSAAAHTGSLCEGILDFLTRTRTNTHFW